MLYLNVNCVVVTTADEVKSPQASTGVDASPKHVALLTGWWQHNDVASLAEVNSSVSVPNLDGKWYQKYWAFAGLDFLISVAYMDPGNWATDLSGGASFGYTSLSIILISNFTAIFLQYFVFETWNCDKSGSGSSMSGFISQMGGVLCLDHHGNCNCIYRSC
jgi:hypothetical protein